MLTDLRKKNRVLQLGFFCFVDVLNEFVQYLTDTFEEKNFFED